MPDDDDEPVIRITPFEAGPPAWIHRLQQLFGCRDETK